MPARGSIKISSDPEVMRRRLLQREKKRRQRERARELAAQQAADTEAPAGETEQVVGGEPLSLESSRAFVPTDVRPRALGVSLTPRDAEEVGRIEAYLDVMLSKQQGVAVDLDEEQAREWLAAHPLALPWMFEYLLSRGLASPLRNWMTSRS